MDDDKARRAVRTLTSIDAEVSPLAKSTLECAAELAENETSVPPEYRAEYEALFIGVKRLWLQIDEHKQREHDAKRLRTLDYAPITILPGEIVRHILRMLPPNDLRSCLAANKALFFNDHHMLRPKVGPPIQMTLKDIARLCDVLRAPIAVRPGILSECVVNTHALQLHRISRGLFAPKMFPLLLEHFDNIVFTQSRSCDSNMREFFDEIAVLIKRARDNCDTPARFFFGSTLSKLPRAFSPKYSTPYPDMKFLRNLLFPKRARPDGYNVCMDTLYYDHALANCINLETLGQLYFVQRITVSMQVDHDGLLVASSMKLLRELCAVINGCNVRCNRFEFTLWRSDSFGQGAASTDCEHLQCATHLIVENIKSTGCLDDRCYTPFHFIVDHTDVRGIFVSCDGAALKRACD
jgi:hypothetical protein